MFAMQGFVEWKPNRNEREKVAESSMVVVHQTQTCYVMNWLTLCLVASGMAFRLNTVFSPFLYLYVKWELVPC